VHAIGYRLTAKLTPSSSSSTASGRWDGVLVHTIGTVQAGSMPSIPGCSVTGPKPGAPALPGRSSGIPHKIKCSGNAVPPFTVPSSGQHWIVGWRLSYASLSSTVNGADIRLNSPGSAGALAATLCGPCTSGKFGRTTLTDDQAGALLKGNGYVVVRTVNNQDGEISGQIVKVAPTATHH
jgi:CHRD domain